MPKNYILGFGISGAIASYYLPNFYVITEPIPRPFPRGPQYLYDDPLTRKLMKDLEMDLSTRTVKVGYKDGKKVVPPNEELLRKYHRATRGLDPDEEWLKAHLIKEFQIIDVTFDDIVQRIYDEVQERIIIDSIISIDLEKKQLIGVNGEYKYKNLISTIPYPFFASMAGTKLKGFTWKNITIAVLPAYDFDIPIYSTEFDYICIPGNPYRITKWVMPFVTAEFIGFRKYSVSKYIAMGKIVSGEVPDLSEFNVALLGRFAKWKKNYKVHDCLKDVMQLRRDLY